MRHVPGRTYDKKAGKNVGHLREEREGGVPRSFQKLESFLKVRRLELADFLMETTKEEVAMDVSGRGDVVLDLELGPEEDLLESV